MVAQHDPGGYYPGAHQVAQDDKHKEWDIAVTDLARYLDTLG